MIDKIENLLSLYPWVAEILKFLGILLLAWLSYVITKKFILTAIQKLIKKTKTEYDDILLNKKVLNRLSLILPLIILNEFVYLLPFAEEFLSRAIESLIVLVIILAIGINLTAFTQIHERLDKYKKHPIKGYVQVVMIILYIWGAILIIGILTGQSPWTLLGGIGALTAVIILIFKDTILSFVASIQISSYDLVQVGDWIEMKKYEVDGDVMDISLNVIKVRNFDKTITTIPTYKLIEESFKNWRGMQQSGGRRIKRAIFVDQSSIKFADDEMLEKYRKINLLTEYINNKKAEIDKHHIGTFREYIKRYLRQRDDINTNLTFLVRHLAPGSEGLPIEIYIFANTTEWIKYEDIQADIFDHILAVVPQFDLRLFQNPTGADFSSLNRLNS
ncbi:mechanosensitive ion channel family protein [Bacteroidota bacterium]